MGEQVASLYAELGINAKGLDTGLASAQGKLKGMQGGLNDAVKGLTGFDLATVGTAAAVGALAAGIKYSIGQAAEAEQVMAQTEAVIKSTGGAAGLSAGEIEGMAGSLSHVSTFSDDAIQKGENLLLTFTNIGKDVFPKATEAMLDMATAMGTDAGSGAIQLGKALNDPIAGISALTRVGVTFTAEQKKAIKSMVELGDVAGAQKVILAELNKEFGGSSVAALNTYSGQVAALKNNFDNLAESVGRNALPPLTALTGALNEQFSVQDRYNAALKAGALTEKDVAEIRLADFLGLHQQGLAVLEAAEATYKHNKAIDDHAEKMNADAKMVMAAGNAYSYLIGKSIEAGAASADEAVKLQAAADMADYLAGRTREVADANDAMIRSHRGWLEGLAGDVVGALHSAGIEGDLYMAALKGIDATLGTGLANEEETGIKLKAIIDQFKKTGDVVAFDNGLKALAEGGASEAAAKLEEANNEAAQLTNTLNNMPRDININVMTNFMQTGVPSWTPGINQGGSGGSGGGGGAGVWTPPGMGGANGLDMIVPAGFPNDSFPIRAQSGEHVQITPAGQGGGGDREFLAMLFGQMADSVTRAVRDGIQQAR